MNIETTKDYEQVQVETSVGVKFRLSLFVVLKRLTSIKNAVMASIHRKASLNSRTYLINTVIPSCKLFCGAVYKAKKCM